MRRARNMLGVVSAALALLASAMWIRSTMRGDQAQYFTEQRIVGARSVGGLVIVYWLHVPLAQSSRGFVWSSRDRAAYSNRFTNGNPWSALGFWLLREPVHYGTGGGKWTWVAVPHWFIVLVFSAAAVWCGRRAWRQRASVRWRAEGRCAGCGYDLRASEGRCPECGRELDTVLT